MTVPGRQDSRRDRAVIMARGLSRRMGTPKGLLQLEEGGPVFVRIITDLYLDLGLSVDVVTLPEIVDDYRAGLAGPPKVRVLAGEPGGDTALTLLKAWRECGVGEDACTHVWAHPVDLPLVTAGTLGILGAHSRRNPGLIVRPSWRGRPGHPVILPGKVLTSLDRDERWQAGPLRDFLEHLHLAGVFPKSLNVEVEDEGVVRDFDRPGDLGPATRPPQNRGTP